MNVEIKNFRNISNLSLNLKSNKINFIYGISGSGKTSIINAILSSEKPEYSVDSNTPIGTTLIPSVSNTIEGNFVIYNDETINNYVIEKNGSGFYKLAMDSNSIREIRTNLEKIYSSNTDIPKILAACQSYEENYESFINHFKINFTKINNSLSKSCQATKSLYDEKTYSRNDHDLEPDHKVWISQGQKYSTSNICPYCEQCMGKEITEKINEIISEYPSHLTELLDQNSKSLFDGVGISLPDIDKAKEPSVRSQLKDRIETLPNIKKNIESIKKIFNHTDFDRDKLNKVPSGEFEIEDKINSIITSEETVTFFESKGISEIKSIIRNILATQNKYFDEVKDYNSKIKKMVSSNFDRINSFLESVGIPYLVEDSRTSENFFINISYKDKGNSKVNLDSPSEYLSTGERNILALILFLYENKNKNIIIDDPASSFDEYRRDKILKEIFSLQSGNTILILSHDQIFLKFLFFQKNNDKIGNILHFSNNCLSGQFLKEINNLDIDYLNTHIKNCLSNSKSYIRKIINLRLFYEIKDNKSLEYIYLSGILHGKKDGLTSQNLISKLENYLNKKCLHNTHSINENTENTLIENMKKETQVELEKFNETELTNFDIAELSNFEKMIYIRELEGLGQHEKNELNNIVHFNESMVHTLNPYKFDFQSKKSYEILRKFQVNLNTKNN